ncbi:hypothetical protein TNCV_4791231, partial [Trichonephila clavipes]
DERRALEGENWRGEPWMESAKERDLVRDWSEKEGKMMDAGGDGELDCYRQTATAWRINCNLLLQ